MFEVPPPSPSPKKQGRTEAAVFGVTAREMIFRIPPTLWVRRVENQFDIAAICIKYLDSLPELIYILGLRCFAENQLKKVCVFKVWDDVGRQRRKLEIFLGAKKRTYCPGPCLRTGAWTLRHPAQHRGAHAPEPGGNTNETQLPTNARVHFWRRPVRR